MLLCIGITTFYVWLMGDRSITTLLLEYRKRIVPVFVLGYLAVAAGLVFWKKKRDAKTLYFLIMIGSLILRVLYVVQEPYASGKHDVGIFSGFQYEEYGFGHLGYIDYLMKNGHLPDFDPRQVWGFYNPPLYHILCAGVLWLTHTFGVPEPGCYESIQCVNFLFSSLTLWLVPKIFQEFSMKKGTSLFFMALLAFHPFFLLFLHSRQMICWQYFSWGFRFFIRSGGRKTNGFGRSLYWHLR